MCILCGCFAPSPDLHPYIETYIKENTIDTRTVGKYAGLSVKRLNVRITLRGHVIRERSSGMQLGL